MTCAAIGQFWIDCPMAASGRESPNYSRRVPARPRQRADFSLAIRVSSSYPCPGDIENDCRGIPRRLRRDHVCAGSRADRPCGNFRLSTWHVSGAVLVDTTPAAFDLRGQRCVPFVPILEAAMTKIFALLVAMPAMVLSLVQVLRLPRSGATTRRLSISCSEMKSTATSRLDRRATAAYSVSSTYGSRV